MKLNEANKKVKNLNGDFSFQIDEYNHCIDLCSKDATLVSIYDDDTDTGNEFYMYPSKDGATCDYEVIKLLIQLHETPVSERDGEDRFKVFVTNGKIRQQLVRLGNVYLFWDERTAESYGGELDHCKACFTKQEIYELKASHDFNLDWNKALEKVVDDEADD
ncbi:hypothetical protein MUDAN_BIHEEGNE_03410 [Lactiplantibacillus mudanjiangensis]|uniref:hypothetical protein n=1 Tax=Lactiplantibacillus mudanjiangensis TaxID=1296538 RepID=UPI00101492A4|nr:hypothetical protein MUDAN_BIHEEGNE_03410 [Lactiplantibacillus mudanjiangensis]